ncbi:class-III pyridoxal-phosphate-dependent aminotransferase [Desulforhopalus singaporensis]|uniref:Taurine---2-oxoglutarate transaminase n=1 Tax=Desulforhopalus singaporensis TaxID=91360 RepID=A0A1H0SK42_9BACT|nr:aspartate aminotransferase family protein [Desulforhopalus singaporensis]SDP41889.1 taurine---2-oxoglutarate transaminase [Desulforhopalus singaporensis]
MANETDWNKVKEWDAKYLLHPFVTSEEYGACPVESTDGDYLVMPDGTRLLDMFNQLYCVNSGQKVPEIQDAIKDALDRFGFVWDIYCTDYKAEVAKILIEDLLGDEGWAGKVRFTNSGGESVEVASIIARLYTGKEYIATREHSYHGISGVAVGLNRVLAGRSHISREGDGLVKQVPGQGYGATIKCPAPLCYRCSVGHSYPECKSALPDGTLPCVHTAEQFIRNHGVDQVAAMITEPAFGAGTIVPPLEYLPQIYEMTRRLGILWIVDEVLMGFGRLGTWFGYQKMGGGKVRPDIVTVAKGLTSSSIGAGAVIVSKEIAAFMDSVRWNHVSTFAGHPIAMAAAVANLKYLMNNNIIPKAAEKGEYFGAKLRELESRHKCVGQVAGYGMFWQVELVKNKETREPFIAEDRNTAFTDNPATKPVTVVLNKCLEKGVLLGGFVPNTLRIGGSLTISQQDMDKAIDALDYALFAVDEMCD